MESVNNGGRAFPVRDGETQWLGMTLRDYFAAHAPSEIPAWFEIDLPPAKAILTARQYVRKAIEQTGARVGDEADFDRLVNWVDDGCYDLPPHLCTAGEAAAKMRAADVEQRAKDTANHRAVRFAAWRWHYADLMLKVRAQ